MFRFFFYLGRCQGRRLIRSRPKWQRRIQRASCFLERFQGLVVPGLRFFYGLRAAIPLTLGMGGYRPVRFFILNLFGTVLWTAVMAGAGAGIQTLWRQWGPVPAAAGILGWVVLAVAVAVTRQRNPALKPEKGGCSADRDLLRPPPPSLPPARRTGPPAPGRSDRRDPPDRCRPGRTASG